MSKLTPAAIRQKLRNNAKLPEEVLIPAEIIEDAIFRHHGYLPDVSQELDIPYSKLLKRINTTVVLQNALLAQREELVDIAEKKLREHLDRGEWKAVKFTLETLGRRRGYEARPDVRQPASPALDNSISAKLDMGKLSIDQLQQLKSMMTTAKSEDPNIIDVTPDKKS